LGNVPRLDGIAMYPVFVVGARESDCEFCGCAVDAGVVVLCVRCECHALPRGVVTSRKSKRFMSSRNWTQSASDHQRQWPRWSKRRVDPPEITRGSTRCVETAGCHKVGAAATNESSSWSPIRQFVCRCGCRWVLFGSHRCQTPVTPAS